MNQIVYVVIDSEAGKVLGACNDFITAKQIAYDGMKLDYDGSEISITPVLVDSVNPQDYSRQFYLTEKDVEEATLQEIALALDFEEDDYAEEEEEEEEEEVYNPLNVKDDFIQRYMETGASYEESCEIADILFDELDDE